jgi:hypothetical protein
MLGVTTVLYMRQTLLDVRWWQAVGVAGALMAFFARELALPANAFWLFFAQYVVGATAATALLARLLPEHLLSEMPVRGAIAGETLTHCSSLPPSSSLTWRFRPSAFARPWRWSRQAATRTTSP